MAVLSTPRAAAKPVALPISKGLLWLLGASHLPPYTSQEPQLAIVEHTTVAFLDHYLKGRPLRRFEAAAGRPGLDE